MLVAGEVAATIRGAPAVAVAAGGRVDREAAIRAAEVGLDEAAARAMIEAGVAPRARPPGGAGHLGAGRDRGAGAAAPEDAGRRPVPRDDQPVSGPARLGDAMGDGSVARRPRRRWCGRPAGRRPRGVRRARRAARGGRDPPVPARRRPALAEDCVQDTLLLALLRLPSLREAGHWPAWLRGIALRVCRRARARLARHAPLPSDDEPRGAVAARSRSRAAARPRRRARPRRPRPQRARGDRRSARRPAPRGRAVLPARGSLTRSRRCPRHPGRRAEDATAQGARHAGAATTAWPTGPARRAWTTAPSPSTRPPTPCSAGTRASACCASPSRRVPGPAWAPSGWARRTAPCPPAARLRVLMAGEAAVARALPGRRGPPRATAGTRRTSPGQRPEATRSRRRSG